MRALFSALAMLCLALLAGGCSTLPQAANMQVADYVSATPHAPSLGLAVAGGWNQPGQIGNEEFAKAVEASLIASQVFSRLVRIEDAVYRLDVVLGDLRQPPGGFNMTTEMTVLWSLSRVDTEATVWQELVASSYTATVGDAFAGVVRLRKSAEGAARQNIRRALERLSAAELPPAQARRPVLPASSRPSASGLR